MKKLLLSLTMVLAMFAASAQNITVTEKETGNVVENGASYYIYGQGNDWGELALEFVITNNSSETITIIGGKTVNTLVDGADVSFCCFENCYPGFTDESSPYDLAAGASTDFSGHYLANENFGETNVDFYIFDRSNPDAKFVINVIFKYSLEDVEEIASQNTISAYPTPATDIINFDYNVNGRAMVVIYNMMGQEVMRNEIAGQNGTLSMNVSDLSGGVYFYSLVINGKTEKSSKIIVK